MPVDGRRDDGVGGVRLRVRQAKAPVGARAAGLQFRAPIRRQAQRGAVVEGRQTARHLPFSPAAAEFVLGFVARIEAAGGDQRLLRLFVARGAIGLAKRVVPVEAQPGEIGADGVGVFFGRAFAIGIVEAQQERAVVTAGEQPVDERGADVADVQAAGRARCEAADRLHRQGLAAVAAGRRFRCGRSGRGLFCGRRWHRVVR